MPLVQADVEFRLSGGNINTSPAASLGGFLSNTILVSDIMNNIWDDISGDEATAGRIEYRCIYAVNKSTGFTWRAVRVWISQFTPSAQEEIDCGIGFTTAHTNTSDPTFHEQSIANETTAPVN